MKSTVRNSSGTFALVLHLQRTVSVRTVIHTFQHAYNLREPLLTLLRETVSRWAALMVTGQLADTPTRGLRTRGLDDSRTGQLADTTGDCVLSF